MILRARVLLLASCAWAAALVPAAPQSGGRHPLSRRQLLSRAALGAGACAMPARRASAIPPLDQVLDAKALTKEALPASEPEVLYTPPAIKGVSTPQQIALAKHLKETGAKMYGAYWCSHCFGQKQAFGAGGARLIDYVECAKDGYKSERDTCQAKEIKGYPTWEINGEYYPGEKSLEELGKLSGFKS